MNVLAHLFKPLTRKCQLDQRNRERRGGNHAPICVAIKYPDGTVKIFESLNKAASEITPGLLRLLKQQLGRRKPQTIDGYSIEYVR